MSQQANQPGPEDDVQMPLGVGGDAPAEEYIESSRPRVNTSTIALVASFAAALAVLYFLGLQNKPRTASATEVQHSTEVDQQIDRMIGSKTARDDYNKLMEGTRSLVDKLQSYFNERMSSIDLNGNPFERDAKVVVDPNSGQTVVRPLIDERELQAQENLRRVANIYSSLKVDLVLIGPHPQAMINKKMATIGDVFGDLLKVTAIRDDGVELTYTDAAGTDKKFFLPMANKNPAPPK